MIETYQKGNLKLPVDVKRKRGLKHWHHSFIDDHLELRIPYRTTKTNFLKIFDDYFDFYFKEYNNYQKIKINDDEIIINAKKYKLNIIRNSKYKRFKYVVEKNTIIAYSENFEVQKIKIKIYHDFLEEMLEEINHDVSKILKNNRIKKRKIKLGYFKTKYGSYHKNLDLIKLNVVLSKMEIKYLYYVLIHEYAHTKIFNHSKEFYLLVEKMMPDYKIYDKGLSKQNVFL